MKILGLLGLSLALLLGAPGCDKDKKEAGQGGADTAAQNKKKAGKLSTPALFKKIPADAVFVFANYERLDADFIDAVSGFLAPIIEKSKVELASESAEGAAFMKEHADLFTQAGLKKIGISTRPFFAMYNHDLSFVIRLELEDGNALLGFVDKLIAKYGEGDKSLASKTVGTMRYWESPPEEDGAFVIGIDKKELVLALMASEAKSEIMPYILGQKKPAKNISDDGALFKVVSENGGAKGVGFFDTQAGMRLLFSGKKGLTGTDFDMSSMSKVCRAEITEMTGIMPRFIFGYDRLNTEEMSMFYGAELRKDIAARLKKVVRPVPGYDFSQKANAPLVMGMGVNVGEALSWAVDISKKLKSAPYQCSELQELNRAFGELENKAAIAEPMVGSIGGFIAILQNFDIANPMNITGLFAIHSTDVGALVGVAKNMIPGMSTLKLDEGSEPVRLNDAIKELPIDVFAARGKEMVAFAVGSSKKSLKELVNTSDADEGPFFAMTYDYQSLMQLMKEQGQLDSDDQMTLDILKKLGDLGFEMRSTESGLVVRSSVSIK